jgi:hypothetical protein
MWRHFSYDEGIVAWRVISKQILLRPWLSVLDMQRHFSDELMAKQMNRTKVMPSTKALWPGASFQNRSYWDRSSLFWIREDTFLTTKALWPGASFQNISYKERSSLFWIREDTLLTSWWQSRWTGHITPGDWEKPLKLWGTLGSGLIPSHISQTNKQKTKTKPNKTSPL